MTTPATAPKTRPAADPIDILPGSASSIYSNIHPGLLAALYTYPLSTIVKGADPVPALLQALIPSVVLQIAYVVLCLPPTTGSGTSAVPKPAKKRVGSAGGKDTAAGKVVPAILSLALTLLAITPLTGILLILFGAPLTTHFLETLLAAAHIALLGFFPLVYVHGVDGQRWREIVGLLLPVDEVLGGMIGTMLGAWLGAVPIPLDWDREWQKWPVTIVTGAYMGYAVGKAAGGLLFKGRKIMFD